MWLQRILLWTRGSMTVQIFIDVRTGLQNVTTFVTIYLDLDNGTILEGSLNQIKMEYIAISSHYTNIFGIWALPPCTGDVIWCWSWSWSNSIKFTHIHGHMQSLSELGCQSWCFTQFLCNQITNLKKKSKTDFFWGVHWLQNLAQVPSEMLKEWRLRNNTGTVHQGHSGRYRFAFSCHPSLHMVCGGSDYWYFTFSHYPKCQTTYISSSHHNEIFRMECPVLWMSYSWTIFDAKGSFAHLCSRDHYRMIYSQTHFLVFTQTGKNSVAANTGNMKHNTYRLSARCSDQENVYKCAPTASRLNLQCGPLK